MPGRRHIFRHFARVAAITAGAMACDAGAGRPLQTEDAGILDRGACEVEGYGGQTSAFGLRLTESGLQLACGVGRSTQLAIAAQESRESGDATPALRLGGKTGLWKGASEAELTLGYGWTADNPAGGSWRSSLSELLLVYSRPFAGGALHANAGWVRDHHTAINATTWGLAYEHDAIGRFAPMAEVFGDDRGPPWWNTGLRFTAVDDRLYLDASFGRQMVTGRPRKWTVGLKLLF